MAQDYWHGGWASTPMNTLPGTQAAMASGRSNYGPLHALADILGAYWQKKNYEGAMKAAAEFGDRLEQEANAPQYVPDMTQDTQGLDAYRDSLDDMRYSGAIPNPDFLGRNNPLVPKGNSWQAQVTRGVMSPSLMQKMQDFANLNPAVQPKPRNEEFAKTQQEHPEWFEGNYYVGNDEALRAKVRNDYQQGMGSLQQGSNYVSGNMEPEKPFTGQMVSNDLSYQDYAAKANSMKAKAMNEITKKYGIQYAQMAEGMIDDAIKDRLSAYGNQKLQEEYGKLFSNRAAPINTQSGWLSFLQDVGNYNNLARQMGQEGITPQELKWLNDSFATNMTQVNAGDRIVNMEAPRFGGKFDNGDAYSVAGSIPLGMNPGQKANLDFQRSEAARNQRNADREFAYKKEMNARDFNLRYQKYKDNLELKRKEIEAKMSSGNGQVNGVPKQMFESATKIIDKYIELENANRMTDPDYKNPLEGQIKQALRIYDACLGNQSGSQGAATSGTGSASSGSGTSEGATGLTAEHEKIIRGAIAEKGAEYVEDFLVKQRGWSKEEAHNVVERLGR